MAQMELLKKRPDLEELRMQHDIDGLVEILETHEEEGNRAARTLARMGDEAVEPLIKALKHKNEGIRGFGPMGLVRRRPSSEVEIGK